MGPLRFAAHPYPTLRGLLIRLRLNAVPATPDGASKRKSEEFFSEVFIVELRQVSPTKRKEIVR
ncbi:MAG TPA: hypothetical protein DEB25_09010 [Desulfobulbaceae bacterium]|nr:hypothetical protein [Desulfobulbaceae bacterium]